MLIEIRNPAAPEQIVATFDETPLGALQTFKRLYEPLCEPPMGPSRKLGVVSFGVV